MSLVERAAKRLEELAKARTGDAPVQGSRQDEAAGSLIERATRKIDPADAKHAALQAPLPPSDAMGAAERPRRDITDGSAPARREPKLGDAMADAIPAAGSQQRSSGVLRLSQRVELDLQKLGAAGYLEPDDPESIMANEFRKIKRPIIQACQGKLATPVAQANRIMVTSSVPGEGKSFISLNLALSIAMERDSTVLLIDADTTRRSLSRLLGIGSRTGLLDLFGGDALDVGEALLRTNVERLTLLPAGQPRRHATELLASEAMEHLVEDLASRYSDRIVIFDTPPLLGAPEPAVLATHMGQILVVVEADKTTHRILSNALTTIQSCPLVTTILNKATARTDAGYYYYAA